jgi:hypothetical protein
MDLKATAKKLIKMAEQIEQDASDKSIFICSECNHTASLTEINQRRTKLAAQEDPDMEVNAVTINDKVSCPVPECVGTMKYFATDASEQFYVEDKEAGKDDSMFDESIDPVGEKKDERAEPEEKKDDSVNVDDLFEDVETQNAKDKAEKQEKAETTQKARKERKDEKEKIEDAKDDAELGIPAQKEPLADPVTKTEPDPAAVKDQPKEKLDIFEEDKPKKPKKKPEEDIIKKDVPKFKSKEASKRYAAASSRYSV